MYRLPSLHIGLSNPLSYPRVDLVSVLRFPAFNGANV
jgi:hypothetical protein